MNDYVYIYRSNVNEEGVHMLYTSRVDPGR